VADRTHWGRYGRRPAVVLSLVAMVDGIDRGILPGVLTKVQDDLGFSDTRAGFLGTVFILTGFLVMLPAGYLADRYMRTRIIAVVLASWGAMSAINATVRSYWQFLGVRAALGVGETVDNPASQSLLADYYRPEVRGRAFALQRMAPIVGAASGTILAGVIGEQLGWRWAFLVVGVPGSLLALAMWRVPESKRGDRDGSDTSDILGLPVPATAPTITPSTPLRERAADLLVDVRKALAVPTLRSVMIGTAIAAGALQGLGFWATAFYERHSTLDADRAAGIAGGIILVGALGGTLVAGRLIDRMRDRVEGAPMLIAGVSQLVGAAILMPTFLPVPLWVRLPGQAVAVALIVGGLVPLAVMTSEVVPAAIRGAAFSLTTFLAALAGATSPLTIGFVADRFKIPIDGEMKGDLAKGFLAMTPLIFVGATVVLRGRRHVTADIAAATAASGELAAATRRGSEPGGA